jgi:hypothetical protein
MLNVRVAAIASLGILLGGQTAIAESPYQYRQYALESSLASVLKISGTRAADAKTLHVRPANIQELDWRAPYVSTGTPAPDPVRDVRFSFYDDQLYRVVVTYDRDRLEGLTNDDVIEGLSATYGVPLLRHAPGARGGAGQGADLPGETTIVAQWEDPASTLTLTRNNYTPEYRLVLISKALDPRARAAIKEALRLDTKEAPQRELDQRKKDAADAVVTSQKARVINKAAFRP